MRPFFASSPRPSPRLSLGFGLAVGLGLSVAACAPEDEIDTGGEEADTPIVPQSSALLTAGGLPIPDVSMASPETGWSTGNWQSESDGTTSGSFTMVAYNAEPTVGIFYQASHQYTDRIVCRNASQVATNFDDANSDSTWAEARHISPPSGIAIIWGDPALAVANNLWFVSGLVVPNDLFTAHINYTSPSTGPCLRNSDDPASTYPGKFADLGVLAGACIFQSPVGQTNFNSSSCFRRANGVVSSSGNDFFDGGTMAVTSNAVYAAYNDIYQASSLLSSVAMYRRPLPTGVWSAVSGDLNIPTDYHPVVVGHPSVASVFVVTTSGKKVLIRRFDGTSWFGPTTIASDYTPANITLNDNVTFLRGHRPTAMIVPPTTIGPPYSVVVFYPRLVGTKTEMQGVVCTPALGCTAPSAMHTPATSTAFFPGVATAIKGNGAQVNALSYWTDAGLTGGKAKLVSSTFTLGGTLSAPVTLTKSQTVCVGDGNGYWGDYDRMWVWSDRTASASFMRSFTDSARATCDTTSQTNKDFDPQDQHVSVAAWAVP